MLNMEGVKKFHESKQAETLQEPQVEFLTSCRGLAEKSSLGCVNPAV